MDCLVAPGGFILILGTWFYKNQVHGFTKNPCTWFTKIQQVWANILVMEHKMPTIHQKTSKNWQPFSRHGGPYTTKSNISTALWTGFPARLSVKYSRGADGLPEGHKSKKCLIFWGPKVGSETQTRDFVSKCQECPWDHF